MIGIIIVALGLVVIGLVRVLMWLEQLIDGR